MLDTLVEEIPEATLIDWVLDLVADSEEQGDMSAALAATEKRRHVTIRWPSGQ